MLALTPVRWRWACPLQDLAGFRMRQANGLGMEQQTMLGGLPVERIPKDGVTQVRHVHAQLVRATGEGL